MENATKALLIAAAILIAILIISLSLYVYRLAADTVGNVNLSEAETTKFNAKFESYIGDRITGAQVNALLATTLTHNQNERAAEGTNTVDIRGDVALRANANTYNKVPTGNFYTVTARYTEGLITRLTVTEN